MPTRLFCGPAPTYKYLQLVFEKYYKFSVRTFFNNFVCLSMARGENGGCEQPCSSDVEKSFALGMMDEQLEPIMLKILDQPMVLKKFETMMLKIVRPVMQPMIISTVQKEIMPAVEPLLSKVVNEEFQKLLPGGTRNDVPKERMLRLKFLDDVLGPVQTSKELRGKNSYPLQVALLDETDHIVTCGLESSAMVEIVLADDSEQNTTHENFERGIIQTGDKTKPHFSKSVCIKLENGIGKLIGLKLGQDSRWTRNYKCSLGVRLLKKLRGIIVKEAWTPPFDVKDNRGDLYKNHDRPCLKSEVWRLKGIGKGGEPSKSLERNNIKILQDFMFWLSVNPKGLQNILHAGHSKWNTIVTHAQDCIIDNNNWFFHKSSTEPQMAVIYDVVGKLKGVIDECHFVPIDNLSADKKDHAHKLLSSVLEPSAFIERYKTFFNDEASLVQKYPYKSSDDDINAFTNSSIQQCSNGNDLTWFENINIYLPTGPGSTSRIYDSGSCVPLIIDTGESCDPASALDVLTPPDRDGGSCEAEGESSRTFSESSFHRIISTMNYPLDDFDGHLCYDDFLRGMLDAMPDHNQLPTLTSPDPMIPYVGSMDYNNTTQMHSQTNETNVYVGSAAPVEPQGVNTDDETAATAPVEPQAVNTSKPPKRWKRLFCVVTWYSISKRVLDVTPKQKRQKLA